MNTIKKLALSAALLSAFSPVFAASTVNAKVAGVRVDRDGRGMVIFATAVTGASCGAIITNALAFDANQQGGRAIMALALAAQASGATVSATGTGTCGIYGGNWAEDWSFGLTK